MLDPGVGGSLVFFMKLFVILVLLSVMGYLNVFASRIVTIKGFGGAPVNITFAKSPINGSCEDSSKLINDACWSTNYKYKLVVQNRFIEYFEDGFAGNLKPITAHYVVISSYASTVTAPKIGISGINTTISHSGSKSILLILPDGSKKRIGPRNSITIPGNADGRVVFAIPERGRLNIPTLYVDVPYLEKPIEFNPMLHMLSIISNLQPEIINESSDRNVSTREAKKITGLLRSFALPFYHASPSSKDNTTKEQREPYNQMNHSIPIFEVSETANSTFLPSFKGGSGITLEFGTNNENQGARAITLHKRAYLSDFKNRVKEAVYTFTNFTKAVVYDIPKATFQKASSKEAYMENVEHAYSNASKKYIELSRDVADLLPFGDVLTDKLGLNEFVSKINSSEVIISSPFSAGIELFVLGPGEAWKTVVKSFHQFGEIMGAILKRVGTTFKAIFERIRLSFSWDDVLINHRVLTAHFQKMVPFMRAEITHRNGNFTNDVSNTIQRLSNFTDQATKMFVNGSFNALPDLISQANKEIYRNLTENAHIQPEQDYDNIQSSFINDHIVSNMGAVQIDVSEEDQKTILDVPKDVLRSIAQLGDDSFQSMKGAYDNLVSELSSDTWEFSTIMKIVSDLSKFVFQFLVEKLIQALLIVFDFVISLFDKILRMRIRLPFVTKFYEKVITKGSATFSCYDMFALGSSMPVTVAFKAFYHGKNLFTLQESQILIATENPEMYVDNLISYAMQVPGQDPSQLRSMYRRTVSYILGSGYASGQLISSAVGFLTTKSFGLYFLRAPFEYMSILSNFPWSWYTETRTKVGVNVRFLSWFLQFLPIFIGWPAENVAGFGFNWISFVASLSIAIPNIYMVFKVWAQDLKLVGDQATASDGSTTIDITLKGTARLVRYFGMILIAAHPFPDQVGLTFRTMILSGAFLQTLRLYVDIPAGSIYSV